MTAKDTPNPIDLHVGQRIRDCRKVQHMSQTALAEALGLTFQQVQKYERGANRVSASMLYGVADKLKMPIAWFFEGLRDPQDRAIAGDIDGRTQIFITAGVLVPSIARIPGMAPEARKAIEHILVQIPSTDTVH